MSVRFLTFVFAMIAIVCGIGRTARADVPVAYETFVKGATSQRGLFTIWRKDGKLYLELAANQLDREFVQTIVPASGVGGQGVVYGNTDHLPTELVRFERTGNSVAIVWPSPYFVAPHDPAARRAIAGSFARTIVALAPVVAVDSKSGAVIMDAAAYLDDQLNLKAILEANIHDQPKADAYVLDKERSYFGVTKAFPKNIIIHALQTWDSQGQRIADVLPDPRHVGIDVAYNIAESPGTSDYRPRYADDRVGIYNDIYLTYDHNRVLSRELRYVVRWNLQPSDPRKPLSAATHPMVFYMSNTVPERYRAAIRAGVLKWNAAFEKIGISDALQVRDQPDDPNWDADDIRYNVLRWVTEYKASFGADSQTLYDPRTGEEFRTGILISADVPLHALREWTHVIDPVRFGRVTDPMPQTFMDETWLSVIMHETGHNLGMQHNFIGSRAYTAKQLQDKSFTSKFGIASTVMEYAPTNLWPRAYGQGDYRQTVLGPYDYYAMKWTYGRVPGAKSPEDEIPMLAKWASVWSDPTYRYASDEDVSWANGHASDPRVEQGILTDDPLAWCDVQLEMDRNLLGEIGAYFPRPGGAYEETSDAFHDVLRRYRGCAVMPTHYIGGQFVSRAHRGDPHAEPAVVPVPYERQKKAFALLDRYLFAADAFRISPQLRTSLGYSEWSGYGYVALAGYGNLPQFEYDPPQRHDVPVAEEIASIQSAAMKQMFLPIVLARIDDASAETTSGRPMRLGDLFDWMHRSVFTELRGSASRPVTASRRTLQQTYVDTLVTILTKPDVLAPTDARAFARAELVALQGETARALHAGALDRETRTHLADMHARIHEALHTDHPEKT